jgi:hypothetical protein
MDNIVTSPPDIAWRKDIVGTIEWPATRKRTVLYARPNPIVAVVRERVAKAEHDLTNAVHTRTLGRACPTDTVCFHAQQNAEAIPENAAPGIATAGSTDA